MSAGGAFYAALGVTVVLLLGAVLTGRAARRKPHFVLVGSAVASLVVTIVFAERFGRTLDLTAAEPWTTVHLTLAKIVTVAFLAPIGFGFLTLKNPARRKLHGRLAYGVLALVGLTFVTGAGMIINAEPRDPARVEKHSGFPFSTVEAAESSPASPALPEPSGAAESE